MRKSASPAPGIVSNLAPPSTKCFVRVGHNGNGEREGDAPSGRILARANHALERGAIQQCIIIP